MPGDPKNSPQADQGGEGDDGFDGPEFGGGFDAPVGGEAAGNIQHGLIEHGQPGPLRFAAGDGVEDEHAGENVGEDDGEALHHGGQAGEQAAGFDQPGQGGHGDGIGGGEGGQGGEQGGQAEQDGFERAETNAENKGLRPGGAAPANFAQDEPGDKDLEDAGQRADVDVGEQVGGGENSGGGNPQGLKQERVDRDGEGELEGHGEHPEEGAEQQVAPAQVAAPGGKQDVGQRDEEHARAGQEDERADHEGVPGEVVEDGGVLAVDQAQLVGAGLAGGG